MGVADESVQPPDEIVRGRGRVGDRHDPRSVRPPCHGPAGRTSWRADDVDHRGPVGRVGDADDPLGPQEPDGWVGEGRRPAPTGRRRRRSRRSPSRSRDVASDRSRLPSPGQWFPGSDAHGTRADLPVGRVDDRRVGGGGDPRPHGPVVVDEVELGEQHEVGGARPGHARCRRRSGRRRAGARRRRRPPRPRRRGRSPGVRPHWATWRGSPTPLTSTTTWSTGGSSRAPCERGEEPVGERAAHAPVGQGDGVAEWEADERGVDVDLADVVDDHRKARAGRAEDLVDQGRLAGAEVAADDGEREAVGRRRGHRRSAWTGDAAEDGAPRERP